MKDKVYFTDGNGNPVSFEAFETAGFTEGMNLPGQLEVKIRCKEGILIMAARCEDEEDFVKLGKLMYTQYKKTNETPSM